MHTLFNAACAAALAGLALVVLGALFGRIHPIIDLFGQFLLPAMVGAALLALVAVLTARYATASIAVALLLACVAIAWPWIHEPAPAQASGPRFKLLTFNVYFHNNRLEAAARSVRKVDADIVVLLEVIPRLRPLLDELAAAYPHRIECWQRPRCDALILSRFPLTDISASLPQAHTTRSLASVRVDVQGRSLALFAAHLILPFPFARSDLQPAQADDVAAGVAAVAGPRILVGDFNASTWGAIVGRQRDAGLAALTGTGGSWPTFLPKQLGFPIDHVLGSAELALQSRRLLTMGGSDHRAVLAEIAFKE